MNKIKKDDVVKVITGKNKGKTGKLLNVDIKKHKVLVEGINVVSVKQKAGKTPGAQESYIIKREAYIDVSNVMLMSDGKPTRVGFKIENNKKVRVARKTGKVIK